MSKHHTSKIETPLGDLGAFPDSAGLKQMRLGSHSSCPKEGRPRSKALHVSLMNEQRLLAQLPEDSPRRRVSLPHIKIGGGS